MHPDLINKMVETLVADRLAEAERLRRARWDDEPAPRKRFSFSRKVKAAIRHFYEAEKPIAVYCHGTAVLVELKLSDGSYLVAGKTITGFARTSGIGRPRP